MKPKSDGLPSLEFEDSNELLEWPDTYDAEYMALTQLQADAFITLDAKLASAVKDLVVLAPFEALF